MRSIVGFILVLMFSGELLACTCIGGKRPVKEEIRNSNVIVVGKVVKKDDFSVPYNSPGIEKKLFDFSFYKVKVNILVVYKGCLHADTIEIITGATGGDCGYNFDTGKTYIIYAYYKNRYYTTGSKVPRYLSTNICTRTRILDNKEIDEIERYKRPKQRQR